MAIWRNFRGGISYIKVLRTEGRNQRGGSKHAPLAENRRATAFLCLLPGLGQQANLKFPLQEWPLATWVHSVQLQCRYTSLRVWVRKSHFVGKTGRMSGTFLLCEGSTLTGGWRMLIRGTWRGDLGRWVRRSSVLSNIFWIQHFWKSQAFWGKKKNNGKKLV